MKKYIIGFILGAIIFGSIGITFAYSYAAKQVSFTPKDTSWKKSNGEEITNVEDAIDELYTEANSEKYGNLINIWNSTDVSINYTYTTPDSGKFLAGILTCNSQNSSPTITTSSSDIIIDEQLSGGGGCNSVIKLIDLSQNETININGYTFNKSNTSRKSSAFLVQLNDINVTEVVNSKLKDDGTATDNYTSQKSYEKILTVVLSSGLKQTISINNPNLSLESRISNSSSIVNYNILKNESSIALSAYGYDYGAGVTMILK